MPPFKDVNAIQHLVEAMLRAALHRDLAEFNPFAEHLAQGLLRRTAIESDHGEVDRRRSLQTGVRQQRGDELLLLDTAGLGFAHQAHRRVFAGLVTHHVEHRQQRGLELVLLQRQRLLAGLDFGVAQLFNFFEYPLGADTRRQLGHHQLPLAARQFLDLPARPAFERAAPAAVGVGNIASAADDLPTARIVGAGNEGKQLIIAELGRLDERHARIRDFAQIVARNFGGQTHGDATGAIEQSKGQAGRQLAWLVGRAVVVGREINRAFVNFIHQQAGDLGQPRLGVTHGGCAVTISGAKVALTVDQRIALTEILGHAHQGVIGRLVTVRMKAAQHVAHHTGTFDRLGTGIAIGPAKAQTHARHGIQDAPLHRLLAVAHIRQGPALDHAQCVFKVGTLRVGRQVGRIAAVVRGRARGKIECCLVGHEN